MLTPAGDRKRGQEPLDFESGLQTKYTVVSGFGLLMVMKMDLSGLDGVVYPKHESAIVPAGLDL